jgi:hypothetical protein
MTAPECEAGTCIHPAIPFAELDYSPKAEPEQATSYPAPEVTSRDGIAGAGKAAVTDALKYATERGWVGSSTYARGHLPHATTGRPGALSDSYAVRLRKGDRYAVAVYREAGQSWKWDSLYVWGAGEGRVPYPTITAWRDAL